MLCSCTIEFIQLHAKSIKHLAEPHILFFSSTWLINSQALMYDPLFIFPILSYSSYLSKILFFRYSLESFLKASNVYLYRCIFVEIRKARGVEKPCLTCLTWSPFQSGQLDISIYLSWYKPKESKCNFAFQIQFGLNLHAVWKTGS